MKKVFTDLNEDVQLQILESLDLADLLAIAQTNKRLSSLAEYVFQRKYSNKMIKLEERNSSFKEDGKITYVHRADAILSILKRFGPLISNLGLEYGKHIYSFENRTMVSSINQLINLKCSETLIQIEIDTNYESFFDDMTRPFKQVENVTIRGEFEKLGNANMTLVEMFPAMKRLSLGCVQVIDRSIIGLKFPHLEHLHIGMFINAYYFNETDVETMLKNNPHIRSFKLGSADRKFLPTVNELLPNLESLELENYNSQSNAEYTDETYFKSVSIVTIYPWYYSGPNNVRFENLTELHTDAFSQFENYHREVDLLKKVKTLKKLYIDIGCYDFDQLQTLMRAPSNLTEFRTKLCTEVTDENIVEFLRNNPGLEKFQFRKVEPMCSAVQTIRKEFGEKWTIAEWESESKSSTYSIDYNVLIECKHKPDFE